jgi:hypothetical protein
METNRQPGDVGMNNFYKILNHNQPRTALAAEVEFFVSLQGA